jgi:glyoxylase-like metal-dependent hydrolase (beta-lactamase superfamily II)
MLKINDHLYQYEDTCNVYVIKNGSDAVLIDFGTGAVLDELESIGIKVKDLPRRSRSVRVFGFRI